MLISTLSMLAAGLAQAQDCDVAALTAAVGEATPAHQAERFAELAACDRVAAQKIAPKVVPRFLAGASTNPGVLAALQVGAQAEVMAWLAQVDRTELGPTIEWLGHQCAAHPEVADFFVAAQQSRTEQFWSERWFRGLADCRAEGIQRLLSEALVARRDDPDRTRFFALVGLYARNLGADALPTLEALLPEIRENQRRLVIEAWADTADVGSEAGMDKEAATAAIASLKSVYAQIPASAADIVRNVLASLGDPQAAEATVALRWPERLDRGSYRYMAAAHEWWTCKNGKSYAAFHYGEVRDPAARWPDTLARQIGDRLRSPWALGKAASKCKATDSHLEIAIVEEPLQPAFDVGAWLDAEREAFAERSREALKTSEIEEPPVQL